VKAVGAFAKDVQNEVNLAGRFFFEAHRRIFLTVKDTKDTKKIFPENKKRANLHWRVAGQINFSCRIP
jgi:hypothetical protein